MSSPNWYQFKNLFSASEQAEDSLEFSLSQYEGSLHPEEETIINMSPTYEQDEESYEFYIEHYKDTLDPVTEAIISITPTSEQEEDSIEFFVEQYKIQSTLDLPKKR